MMPPTTSPSKKRESPKEKEVETLGGDLESLSTSDLQIDYSYQRDLNEDRVQEIMDDFSEDAFGTPIVNRRPDGSLFLVDGQHRREAAIRLYGHRKIWCRVIKVPGPAEEAAIFYRVNAGHVRPGPSVLFQGRITQGDPSALEISRIAEEERMPLCLRGKPESADQLAIPSVLDQIYKKRQGDGLKAVLRFVRETWGGQKKYSSSAVVSGVARFFDHYGEHKNFDAAAISQVLKAYTVEQVYWEAKRQIGQYGYHRHTAFAAAMQHLYNEAVPAGQRIYQKEERGRRRGK
jgi:hypothetical protein